MKVLFFLVFSFSTIFAQNGANTINTHMTPTDQQNTGIEKLSPEEQKALQQWINDHHTPNSPTEQHKENTADLSAVLSQNIANGKYIELVNDSVWKIHPDDTSTAASWISPIMINVSPNADSSWPYLLTNSVTSSKVRAQKISQLPSFSSPTQQGPDQVPSPQPQQDQIAPIESPNTGPP